MVSVLKAVSCYVGGSALFLGGPLVGGLLIRRGRHEQAAYERECDARSFENGVRSEMRLAELYEQARMVGVDPRQVEQAFRDHRDGIITIDQLLGWLQSLGGR